MRERRLTAVSERAMALRLTFELVGGPHDGMTVWRSYEDREWPTQVVHEGACYAVETDELDPPSKQTASFVGWSS
jgi:hypothetical protein